jgi:hypothetical protein
MIPKEIEEANKDYKRLLALQEFNKLLHTILGCVMLVFICVACFAIGYYYGKDKGTTRVTIGANTSINK